MSMTLGFLAIPAEIRLVIYNKVYPWPPESESLLPITNHYRTRPEHYFAILATCRIVYDECLSLAFRNTPFHPSNNIIYTCPSAYKKVFPKEDGKIPPASTRRTIHHARGNESLLRTDAAREAWVSLTQPRPPCGFAHVKYLCLGGGGFETFFPDLRPISDWEPFAQAFGSALPSVRLVSVRSWKLGSENYLAMVNVLSQSFTNLKIVLIVHDERWAGFNPNWLQDSRNGLAGRTMYGDVSEVVKRPGGVKFAWKEKDEGMDIAEGTGKELLVNYCSSDVAIEWLDKIHRLD